MFKLMTDLLSLRQKWQEGFLHFPAEVPVMLFKATARTALSCYERAHILKSHFCLLAVCLRNISATCKANFRDGSAKTLGHTSTL